MTMRCIAVLAIAAAAAGAFAGPQDYTIVKGEVTFRHCLPPCACPYWEISGPVDGTFELVYTGSDPLYDHYDVEGVMWTASIPFQPVVIKGEGTYRIGGEFVLVHQLRLTLSVDGGTPREHDSGLVLPDPMHKFPEIAISFESEIEECTQNVFTIIAAPGCYADCEEDGDLDLFDFLAYQGEFVAGCP